MNPIDESAWNPGLSSEIPARLLPLVTMFREEHALIGYSTAKELAGLTGLDVRELAAFKPQRLVVHALLVRVTADLSVPDGPNYEDLGISLRGMVETIYSKYIFPRMNLVIDRFDAELDTARNYVEAQLSTQLFVAKEVQVQQSVKPGWIQRWFTKSSNAPEPSKASGEHSELLVIEQWKQLAQQCDDPLEQACLTELVKIVGRMFAHRGRMILDVKQLTDLVVNRVGNTHGSNVINEFIEPFWHEAIDQEHFRLLPAQAKPVVMNVKGASASGKSTIRPRQRALAEKLDIPWEDFAVISPDYWRKYLLDYSSLGEDFKYGAMLTGRELEIIDKKLDSYMARKASEGLMSHLLIDRFRFDSFTVDIDRKKDSKLLSRFGDVIYLFFMVTHPAETVERAWLRGKTTGRYKAVDDLLYHNVEAFTGMPSLFLSWINSRDRKVHFEFLDNDVPKGELPRTAIFGWNGIMTVLDVQLLVNIDRYRTVNIAASQVNEVFNEDELHALPKPEFIVKCAEKVHMILFADRQTAQIYASVQDGKLHWLNRAFVEASADESLIRHVLGSLGNIESSRLEDASREPPAIDVPAEQHVTVGCWF